VPIEGRLRKFGVDLGRDLRQQASRDTEVDFVGDPERAGDQVAQQLGNGASGRAAHGLAHQVPESAGVVAKAGPRTPPRDAPEPLAHEFRHAVLAGLASGPRVPGPKHATKQKPGRELLEFCRDRRDDVLRLTIDTSIWPTNNISERGVRPLKTQHKISGRLASDDLTQDRLDIRSYTDTARKHGKNAFAVPCDLMTGRPWRPPAQAFPPYRSSKPRATDHHA
jgi:hypothetical protein